MDIIPTILNTARLVCFHSPPIRMRKTITDISWDVEVDFKSFNVILLCNYKFVSKWSRHGLKLISVCGGALKRIKGVQWDQVLSGHAR